MADNNEVKSRRDQHLDRLRSKYPDKKFEDDEEIYGQISDDYDTYEITRKPPGRICRTNCEKASFTASCVP